jgi:hypothetical protein
MARSAPVAMGPRREKLAPWGRRRGSVVSWVLAGPSPVVTSGEH